MTLMSGEHHRDSRFAGVSCRGIWRAEHRQADLSEAGIRLLWRVRCYRFEAYNKVRLRPIRNGWDPPPVQVQRAGPTEPTPMPYQWTCPEAVFSPHGCQQDGPCGRRRPLFRNTVPACALSEQSRYVISSQWLGKRDSTQGS